MIMGVSGVSLSCEALHADGITDFSASSEYRIIRG